MWVGVYVSVCVNVCMHMCLWARGGGGGGGGLQKGKWGSSWTLVPSMEAVNCKIKLANNKFIIVVA